MKYASFFVSIFLSVWSGVSTAVEPSLSTKVTEKQIVVIDIQGQISKKVLQRVRQLINNVRGDPIPAGLIVLLDSPGGDGLAAMEIGRLLRSADAHIFVTGQCASACIFLLASGVVRSAVAYSVGIHRGRITISDADAKITREVDVEQNPKAKAALLGFESQAMKYFQQMGMSEDLFPLMQAHGLKGVYRMSGAEISKMGLVGFEKSYLDRRASFYESLRGPHKMSADEYMRRTMRVGSRCGHFDKKHQEFIRCYVETIKSPFLH